MNKIFAVALSTLFVAACAQNNNPVDNVVEASEDPALQAKNFTSKCSLTPIDAILSGVFTVGSASVKSSATVYRFTGANIARTTYIYQATDCTGEPAIVFTEKGSFDILNNNRTPDGARLVNFEYTQLEVLVDSQAGVEVANAISLCGTNNWVLDQSAVVTTKAADVNCYNAAVPRLVANVYKIEGKELFLGTPTKGSVGEAARPSAIDRSQVYTEK